MALATVRDSLHNGRASFPDKPLATDPLWCISAAELSEAQFGSRYRHSPIRRAKRTGFLRNVRIALRNSETYASLHAPESHR